MQNISFKLGIAPNVEESPNSSCELPAKGEMSDEKEKEKEIENEKELENNLREKEEDKDKNSPPSTSLDGRETAETGAQTLQRQQRQQQQSGTVTGNDSSINSSEQRRRDHVRVGSRVSRLVVVRPRKQ